MKFLKKETIQMNIIKEKFVLSKKVQTFQTIK